MMRARTELAKRLTAKGPDGKLLNLVRGDETTEELRELIIQLSQSCPAGNKHRSCPFCTLAGLTYNSLTNLVNKMPHEGCLELFEMEQVCRSRHQENP